MVGKINKYIKIGKSKFWLRLFMRVAAIFVAFVLVLAISNTAFLAKYFEETEKSKLRSVSNKFASIDLDDSSTVIDLINEIQEDSGFEVEIYNNRGTTLYSSSGGQMLDYLFQKNPKLSMNHRPLKAIESKKYSDGSVLETAIDNVTKKEYLVYRFSVTDDNTAELRVQRSLIQNSARIANKFILIIAGVIFALSLVWVLWFSRRIAKPISQMNQITGQMARLDFSQKLDCGSSDEIGQLAISINNLSLQLDETLRDLKASNAKLRDEIELERQLDVMRRDFVANVSHELKTPISIIQGYAEGLKLNVNTDSRQKYCDTIIDESHRMNKLVLSLLNLSKYESGQVPLNIAEFDITLMAHSMAERILNDRNENNINVEFKMPDSLLVSADPEQTEQVFKSYLENAKSHVNRGGTVKIEILPQGGECCVSVTNTGSHIDQDKMPHIWQSFYRGDSSHKRDSTRFGLGLSIVSAVVKLHGKQCGVYNTENGVCFWFTLNLSQNNKG